MKPPIPVESGVLSFPEPAANHTVVWKKFSCQAAVISATAERSPRTGTVTTEETVILIFGTVPAQPNCKLQLRRGTFLINQLKTLKTLTGHRVADRCVCTGPEP